MKSLPSGRPQGSPLLYTGFASRFVIGALLAWWAPLRPLRAGRRPAGLADALATLAGWPSPCWPG
ncbi:MAG: hypothetical protein E6J04_02185 [Chloroflexi bacterium]|nr:MAG: hypothetical protein E6J04_02185 [Chloroflexota bacterium]